MVFRGECNQGDQRERERERDLGEMQPCVTLVMMSRGRDDGNRKREDERGWRGPRGMREE